MDAKKHSSYTETVIQAHDLAAQWSPQVIAETKELAGFTREQFQGRCLDFTDLPFVTIDGDDARDSTMPSALITPMMAGCCRLLSRM